MLMSGFMALTLFCACESKGSQFVVSGELADSLQSSLYLYEVVSEARLVDSTRIEQGKFTLRHSTSGEPKLYLLSSPLGSLYFVADSSTQMQIKQATQPSAIPYIIETADEENKAIYAIQKGVREFEIQSLQSKNIAQLDSLVTALREHLLRDYIYANPRSMAAIVALLQAPHQIPLFQAESGKKQDVQAYGAVATAFETFRPTSLYTPVLREKALLGMAIKSDTQAQMAQQQRLINQAQVASFPPITLYDNRGVEQSLAKVAQQHNKVILAFVAMSAPETPRIISKLRAIYKQEETSGLEIFLVALDPDKSSWLQAVRTLPWISTWDPEGKVALTYNVRQLPTFYMIQNDEIRELTL